ncbi:ferritin-like domain-containing protein [Clostridium sp. KNHs214]|uniref:spore coat protein n=1 Tax=Clostridium sp. KNHs214 TaxID=1540257 RepID=UPI000559416B|nr:ferritin-like domain-containing protein [Clostridium sp. KNHs214]
MNLSQKETMLLQDQKSHEQLCIEKYTNYANRATDSNLKQMFLNHASQEQEHLNTINQMLNGQVPNLNQQSTGGTQNSTNSSMQNNSTPSNNSTAAAGMDNVADGKLCEDLLMTEKYVSNTYDTTIFEFKDSHAREVLNHIQKEEQKHGEDIFNYMNSKGLYSGQ